MEREITLYDIKRENGDWFILRAYLQDGKLKLEGQDFTGLAENMFGSEEYECFYYFDLENTKKLAHLLNTDELLKGLAVFFGGEMKDREFFAFCKENDVQFSFSSWV